MKYDDQISKLVKDENGTCLMNFEDKLSHDLPWTPRVIDEWQKTKLNDGLDDDCLQRYSLDDYRFFEIIFEQMYRYLVIIDKRPILHRVGGPASYLKKDTLLCFEYYFLNKKYSCKNYWIEMAIRYSSIYEVNFLCDGSLASLEEFDRSLNIEMIYFKALKNVPCPFSYNPSRSEMKWVLNNKFVLQSEYWNHWERRSVTVNL